MPNNVTAEVPDKEYIMENFGNNIRNLRLLKKMTQQEFADQLSITRPQIGSYEDKRALPALPILVHISNRLDVDINTLLMKDIFRKEDSHE